MPPAATLSVWPVHHVAGTLLPKALSAKGVVFLLGSPAWGDRPPSAAVIAATSAVWCRACHGAGAPSTAALQAGSRALTPDSLALTSSELTSVPRQGSGDGGSLDCASWRPGLAGRVASG